MPHRFFRLLTAGLLGGALLSAQETQYTLRVDVPLVSVDVTVEDSDGNPVGTLGQNTFEVYEDGVRQDIRNFSPVSTPYNVFLLFDRSGSTRQKWAFMERAVAGFVAGLRPQDRLAIAAFDTRLESQLDWTGDRTKAARALLKLMDPKALGETHLYDSIDRALRREFKKVAGRRALVVLTDGRDTSLYLELARSNRLLDSPADRLFQKALKAARETRIPVYFVAVNTDKNLEPNAQRDEYQNLHILFPKTEMPQRYLTQVRTRMEELAEVSGGRILFPSRIEEIVPLYQQIGRELGMSYSLAYVSSNPAANGSFRRIEVRLRDSSLRITQSRSGYYAK
ncbi:MAG: VWA domain-containing protein [Acidobacteria bacterium]|nr:VWA domain-containing protein [Acidobacteriota bacterium]